ncbi:gas vesicle protein [Streptomyces sp. NBC_00859]|uniref:gas vesicle protein GvpO n=1 Tax=Streptomyces sp. NBC_00859 TaxID=2903682 RepID=UPI00386EB789|nr:gas vesicle protein [Streptomyces sp. NBC_00859]
MATTESQNSKGSPERLDISTAMQRAAEQLAQMLQREPSSVSAVKATEDGWSADVEVTEIEKVPDTASVMATYRVSLDAQGQLLGYERVRRYAKGQIDR